MTIELIRRESTDQGTFGTVQIGDKIINSLELPDRDNQSNISCIPEGEYEVARRYSPAFKRWTYHVTKVPNRGYILIHPANFAGDEEKGWQTNLQGCIGLGMDRGYAFNKHHKKQRAIFRSRQAVREFEDFLNRETFTLKIRSV